MLSLTRRVGEVLCIGKNVEVYVWKVHGRQVVLGVKAPKGIAVDRLEIRRRKAAEPGFDAGTVEG